MARTSDVPMTRRSSGRTEPNRWGTTPQDMTSGPWGLMRQMQDQMDRWFNRFGLGSGWTSPMNAMSRAMGDWTPAIDAFQRGNEFIIRADVPGMTRHDLSVEIGDDSVTIHGERKQEDHGEDNGMFWSERNYGSFYRVVPIPPGAIADSAKATFANGVLEITLQAPSAETRRGRKIDISGRDDSTRGGRAKED